MCHQTRVADTIGLKLRTGDEAKTRNVISGTGNAGVDQIMKRAEGWKSDWSLRRRLELHGWLPI